MGYFFFFGALTVSFVLGLLIGSLRSRMPLIPYVYGIVIILAYAALVMYAGISAARCWTCNGGGADDTRGFGFAVVAVYFGVLALVSLVGIGLGSRSSRRRLHRKA